VCLGFALTVSGPSDKTLAGLAFPPGCLLGSSRGYAEFRFLHTRGGDRVFAPEDEHAESNNRCNHVIQPTCPPSCLGPQSKASEQTDFLSAEEDLHAA
jgi:hypothetical protein